MGVTLARHATLAGSTPHTHHLKFVFDKGNAISNSNLSGLAVLLGWNSSQRTGTTLCMRPALYPILASPTPNHTITHGCALKLDNLI